LFGSIDAHEANAVMDLGQDELVFHSLTSSGYREK
jgi:hypothetical protein